MRASRLSLGLATLSATAIAQTQWTGRYCDPASSLCFTGWTGANGVTIGVALPNVTEAPFDTVLQIISPIANGWVGFSWGGTMPYVPLTIGWPVNASSTAIYSSRIAYGLSLPQPYEAAEYTYLKGTGLNTTHWTLNVRCRGCSQWHDVDGKLVSLDPYNGSTKFAHALASRLPAQPANNRSTFNVHTKFGHWFLDLQQGLNENFDQIVESNLVEDTPPVSSSVPVSTQTSSASTLNTSIRPTPTAGPIQSGVPSSCSGVNPLHFPLSTAAGWKVAKVAGNLVQPRSIIFDSAGNLLLVQNGLGITAHTIGSDGCFTSSKTIISQRNLNHGIVLSGDGKTLYASSATSVFVWSYDAATMSVSGSPNTILTGMDARGHVTRTLTIPPKHPNLLLVSHGSNDNFDYESGDIKVGRSCIKVFDLSKVPAEGYRYATDGYNMGYGLRNTVGMAFDSSGMLWGVENSSDEIHRTIGDLSTDIHTDNPADELNYLGDPSVQNTQWYGYPTCHTVWEPSSITDKPFSRGDQFVLAPNATFTDSTCATTSQKSRVAFQAHSAPLDAVFDEDDRSLYVTFHGSWNRSPSTGYKVVGIPFERNEKGVFGPAETRGNESVYADVMWNVGEELCSTTQCFRPVGMARDRLGRFYVSSDSGVEGEVVVLGKV
ncbi:iron reductase domain protein [Sporormia fimetaria CBS 119925]|uniref:Iron reductase domain protein n=1 Tax=Sporormia fimetaria CBS 119925 TaxID=1340428 RepID=A0A6A6UYI1_9PLEO|nr:iron reductase domain protein [Sporormia fimetaria CBS 119925]